MGTHAVVHFFVQRSRHDKIRVVTFYFQYDGYLEGVGKDLVDFLKSYTIVNGIPFPRKEGIKYANGIGCLAAQFCKEFKNGAGNFYIEPYEEADAYYTYEVVWIEESEEMQIVYRNETPMSISEFEEFIIKSSC
jgi:hypothetical protein